MSSPSLFTILRDHVSLSITSFDRLYLGGYLPTLQTGGQLVTFCQQRCGASIASPALFGPLTDRFVRAVHQFATLHDVPVIHFVRGQRKDIASRCGLQVQVTATLSWSSTATIAPIWH